MAAVGRTDDGGAGVRSLLTLRLFVLGDTLGALSLYSKEPDAFDAEGRAEGEGLAAQISIAVLAAQQLDDRAKALDSRTVIAQACGLIMERYDVDAVRAFDLLARLSSEQNIKLREIAAELVLTRELPISAA